MRRHPIYLLVIVIFLSLGTDCLYAYRPSDPRSRNTLHTEAEGVTIEENLGATLPLSLAFTNHHGVAAPLQEWIHETPVILSLVYYECPMMCHYVLDGIARAMDQMALKLGKDYKVITVSFNPKDTTEEALKAHQKYFLGLSNHPQHQEGDWQFLIGSMEAITPLATSIGFRYKYLEKIDEYSHNAAIYMISPKGKITRYLYGVTFKPMEVKLALLEAKDEQERTSFERFLLFCYTYKPDEGGYALHAYNAMRLAGLVTVLFLVTFLIIMFLKERRSTTSRR